MVSMFMLIHKSGILVYYKLLFSQYGHAGKGIPTTLIWGIKAYHVQGRMRIYGSISHQIITNNTIVNSSFQLFILLLFNLLQVQAMEVSKGWELDLTQIITAMFFRVVQGIIALLLPRWICCLLHHFQVLWATIYRLQIIIWSCSQPPIIVVLDFTKMELYLAMAISITIIICKIQ